MGGRDSYLIPKSPTTFFATGYYNASSGARNAESCDAATVSNRPLSILKIMSNICLHPIPLCGNNKGNKS